MDQISRQTEEAEQKVRILYEITRFVSSFLYVQHVLDAIVDLLVKEFNLDACSIRLLDSEGKLRIKSHKGLSKAFLEKATRKPTIDSYSGDCFLTGRIVIVSDADRIDKPISTNLMVAEEIKSFAVSPIKAEGETIGVVSFCSKKKNHFHERFNDVIYAISNQIGVLIKITQLYEEIYQLNQKLEEKVKERTAELEEKTKQLVAAERLATLGEMSKKIAHELRNPLAVVGGLARRMKQNPANNERDKEYLKIMVEEIMNLEDKVSKIVKIVDENNNS
ncbi:MAG: GAF domain-containing protein [Deltaproteobacteria bacterium]|nr:GAF domain-containing protein [Deltaproteobacteria bacterium]MBW1738547.1 GAF domain-containing protein [Deltaproteobacteria bacterium]MBW1909397.1 GAF domain-containing protein [Deltaproteobacteria bacterium]MBW2032750.1 GAF domain-containing protein [Deltaproteobacteria bacterium]MBW2115304.1 GAF domain-containing protein [Deltaproteobacteria bacterium]